MSRAGHGMDRGSEVAASRRHQEDALGGTPGIDARGPAAPLICPDCRITLEHRIRRPGACMGSGAGPREAWLVCQECYYSERERERFVEASRARG